MMKIQSTITIFDQDKDKEVISKFLHDTMQQDTSRSNEMTDRGDNAIETNSLSNESIEFSLN